MYRTHSIVNWLLTVSCICCLNVAQAHTIISSSYPEDNQVLPLITQDATLNFVAPVVILKIELLGELIREDLDISNNAGASKTIVAKFPQSLSDGRYTLNWSALSEDGHNLTGTLSFTLASL